MRNKFIRFFISSTFADMELERNLLQEVFEQLAKDYNERGWQIEAIDLRWGISKEAGLDNKTMQICLSELRRCQQMSPKPNFIVLLGDRYGWIPLPELIPQEYAEKLPLDEEEKRLFDDWYVLDRNFIHPQYVLKKRLGVYENKDTWEDKVEAPLSHIFKKYHLPNFGLSATEQEIHAGALRVKNAREHVIAFMRHFVQIDSKNEEIYLEKQKENQDKLDELKKNLRSALDSANILPCDNLAQENYGSKAYCHDFKVGMKLRITNIVDRIIKEREKEAGNKDLLTIESQQHLTFAREEASGFVGREKEIRDICNYVEEQNNNQALWIKAPSGVGKTALLSKIVTLYEDSHYVICRHCGRTEQALKTDAILGSIWYELKRYDKSHICDIDTYMFHYSYLLKGKLENYVSDKPLLLIVDGINMLDDKEEIMASLQWLPESGLSKQVKVIFSSTDELRYEISRPQVRSYILGNLEDDAISLINTTLSRNGRCLTAAQIETIKKTVKETEGTAIYLKVLSQYLSRLASDELIASLPQDLSALVKFVINHIVAGGHFDRKFVAKVLSLVSQERLGLTPSEILEIASSDKIVFDGLRSQSFHDLKSPKIPIVIWSRLYFELSPFMRDTYTTAGWLITIYHSALKEELQRMFLPSHEEKAKASIALYDYYKQKDLQHNLHANSEMMFQGYIAACHFSNIDTTQFNELRKELWERLTDIKYIIWKYLHFKNLFNEEIDLLSSLYSVEEQNILYNIKKEMAESGKKCRTAEQFEYYFTALPHNSILRQLANCQLDIPPMENTLADGNTFSNSVYIINKTGKCLKMREDGEVIAYLTENCHKVNICNLAKNVTNVFSVQGEIEDLDFDETFRYVLICTKVSLILYDTHESKNSLQLPRKDITWFSLGKKKNILACGEKTGFSVYDFNGNGVTWQVPTLSGMLSPSGNYLWLIDQDYIIHRFDMIQEKPVSFGKSNSDNLEDTRITKCSEEWMAYGKHNLIYHYLEDGADKHVKFDITKGNVYFCEDEETMAFEYDGNVRIVALNKDGNNFRLDTVRMTHIDSLLAVSRSMKYALLNQYSGLSYICDFKKEIERFLPMPGGNTGINNLTCDYQGHEIIISAGINHNDGGRPGDINMTVLRVTNGVQHEWTPPFSDDRYRYVSTAAISPDGKTIATASCGQNSEIIIVDNRSGQRIKTIQTGHHWCVAMDFSSDGRYLAAHTGNYFADSDSILYLISSDGSVLLQTELKENYWSLKNHIRISYDNKYIFSAGSYSKAGIFSIEKKKQLFTDQEFRFYSTHITEGSVSALVKEKGFIAYLPSIHSVLANDNKGRVCILDLENESYITTDVIGHPMAVSASGRHIFFLNNGTLIMRNWPFDDEEAMLMDKVRWVVPSLNEEYVFITLEDYYILLYNIRLHRVEKKAYFGLAAFQKICNEGLIVAFEGEGKAALFSLKK